MVVIINHVNRQTICFIIILVLVFSILQLKDLLHYNAYVDFYEVNFI